MYRIKDVATELNISQKSVRRFVSSGDLVASKVSGVYQISKENFKLFKKSFKGKLKEERSAFSPTTCPDVINWIEIQELWEDSSKTLLTSADLFCGAGGMAKGFELAGYTPLCGLDWFKEAGQTYSFNLNHPFIHGDIQDDFIKEKFISTVQEQLKGKPLTVLSGGFPCQGFSMSGNRIVEDPRNSLYKDMLEIIKSLKPLFIVAENVKGLRSMLKGQVEKKIKEDIENLGYEVNVTVLNAADYYVPQKRERVIFIANRIGVKNYHPKPLLAPEDYKTTADAIGDLVDLPDSKEFNHVRTKHSKDMKARLAAVPEGKSLYKNYSDSWKKCPWNEASCTVKENHGGVNIHPIASRVITVREMARLQSFPDDFIFLGSKAKQMVQIGNAVPPLLAKAIGLSIRKALKANSLSKT